MKLRFYTICKVASSFILMLAFSAQMTANSFASVVQVEGGTITTADNTTVCTSDDVADIVSFSVSGADGPHKMWVVTDDAGNILATQPGSSFDFSNAPDGECVVYHMSFKAFVFPPLAGVNVNSLVGWFALSNGITVYRQSNCTGEETGEGETGDETCSADGGSISGGPFTFCVQDGTPDVIQDDQIVLTGNSGTSRWLLVEESTGNLAGFFSTGLDFFDNTAFGTVLLYNISFTGDLEGLPQGQEIVKISDLGGCFDLSNPITIIKEHCTQMEEEEEEETCASVVGGTISGGPFNFCVGDGIADNIHADGVVLSSNTGSSQWVVTDESGSTILGLPPTPQAVDFDGAGVATCLLWHLSYDGELTGAVSGGAVADLAGCFSLSNSIPIYRQDCSPTGNDNTAPNTDGDAVGDRCGVNSGSISLCDGSGTNINVCTSDGVDSSFDVCVTGNEGGSFWVIIDSDRNLIAQQDGATFDFEGVPAGLCIICHVSYEGELSGLEPGMPVDLVEGCVDFSNEISVTRFVDDPAYCHGIGGLDEPELSFQTLGNPVSDQLRLQITSEFAGQHRVVIYDIIGRTLFNNTIPVKEGTTTLDIDASDFDPGIHFINVNNGQESVMESFVKESN